MAKESVGVVPKRSRGVSVLALNLVLREMLGPCDTELARITERA